MRLQRTHGHNAGVVDQNIDASELAARHVEQAVDLLRLTHVAGNGADLGAQAFNLLAGTR